MANDYGCPGDLKCTGLFAASGTDNVTLGDAFVKYFKVTKNCETGVNQGCWAAETKINYDGSPAGTQALDAFADYKFITADGMTIFVANYKNNCLTDGTGGSTNVSNGRTGNMTQTCGTVFVDVNGLKKPNAWGRDTFLFFITNGKGPLLYPRGGADDNWGGNDDWWSNNAGGARICYSGNQNGVFCTGRVMEQGWQMNY